MSVLFKSRFNRLCSKPKERKKHFRWRWVFLVLGIGLVVLFFIVFCNLKVKKCAEGRIYNDAQVIPARKVGLLLGTMPYTKNGNVNRYYANRIDAAAQLYFAQKISYILISGDNHRHGYNEPEDMRQSLIALGVPDSVIYLDYAGFRTFDSMIRAKEVFGQDSVTVISQCWHNERAIYIAEHHSLDAIAFNAKDVRYRKSYLKNHTREALAKVKVVLDDVFHKQPRYLGEYMMIPGSQSTAYKDSIRSFSYPNNVKQSN